MKSTSLLAAAALLFVIVNACTDSTGAGSGGDDDDDDDNGSSNGGNGTNSSNGGNASNSSGNNSSNGGTPGSSCEGVAATCAGSKNCCAVANVPGGTFNRSNDPEFPATVSTFALDVYEVTVGRFRNYVDSGAGTQASPPAVGAGAHPKIANSGWRAGYTAQLAENTAALKEGLKCDAGYPAWTDAPGANENKPINCVTWFDALAFCAWDGGRLPTEAEWEYAAAGGADQRPYPFGDTITQAKAAYNCSGRGEGTCTFSDMLAVGSKSPAGDGKFGHADLAGNMWEYVLDTASTALRIKDCNDCADLTGGDVPENKMFRGGGFPNEEFYLLTADRSVSDVAAQRDYDVGIRCARAAK